MQLEFLFFRGRKKRVCPVRGNGDGAMAAECVQVLKRLGLSSLEGRVSVVWNGRMRTTAGRAFWPEGRIELNPKLREVAPEEVRRTMLHELAHLVAYARAGRRAIKAHGPEWRRACVDVGIPDERVTHSLPLPGRTMRRRWRYTCPVCGEWFDRVRRMKRYAGCYACCKAHNGGYYDKRFRLRETKLS